MVQLGVVAAWAGLLTGQWGLATALLVANAVSGFDWFGRVAGSVVTEAPGIRAWMNATSELAGGGDLMDLPAGRRPRPRHRPGPGAARTASRCARSACATSRRSTTTARSECRTSTSTSTPASWCCCSARSAPASPACSARWPAWSPAPARSAGTTRSSTTRRPRSDRHAWPTSPRCRACCPAPSPATSPSTTPHRAVMPALESARMGRDVTEAGGPDVARRAPRRTPLRRSGAAPRAGARAGRRRRPAAGRRRVARRSTPTTEIELWQALRARGAAVIGATSKAAALAQADRVVVLDAGRVVDDGPWRELSAPLGPPGRLRPPRPLGRLVGWRHARRHRRSLGVPRHPPDRRTCASHGHEVTALVRREPTSAHESPLGPPAPATSTPALIDRADAVVNLAGASIAGNPHSKKCAQEVLESRVSPPACSPARSRRPSARPRSSPATASAGTATTATSRSPRTPRPAATPSSPAVARAWEAAADARRARPAPGSACCAPPP